MIFITGPLYSGKKTYARSLTVYRQETTASDVQDLVTGKETPARLEQLADHLAGMQIVTQAETGGGVVPVGAEQRAEREAAGRLACLLASRADTVVRVFCGIPMLLKGPALPERREKT